MTTLTKLAAATLILTLAGPLTAPAAQAAPSASLSTGVGAQPQALCNWLPWFPGCPRL